MSVKVERLRNGVKALEKVLSLFPDKHRKTMASLRQVYEIEKMKLEREVINEKTLDDLFKKTMGEVNQIFEGGRQ